jgi:hypothetical protein
MIFDLLYMTFGLLLFIFSHELADGLNRFSVGVYERVPILKKLPGSNLAGTPLNYKTTFYFCKAMGVLMVTVSFFFLHWEMRN